MKRHRYTIPALLFATALILRLVFFFIMLSDLGADHLIDQYQDPIKYVRAAEFLFGRADIGKTELYLVGPGYPLLIGLCTPGGSSAFWPVLIIQIILSTFTCVLIYRTALFLLGNSWIATTAGFLAVVSPTSISLANAVVSETLFFFLQVLSLYLFFKAIGKNQWRIAVFAGLTGGATVLVRSAAMLFPLVLIISGLLMPVVTSAIPRRQIVIKSIVVALIMLALPTLWGVRNLIVHDTFTVSSTGLLAAKTYLAAKVTIEGEKRHIREFKQIRDSLYQVSLANYEQNRYKQDQQESMNMIKSTFSRHPSLFIKHYLLMVFYNSTSISSLQHVQIPGYSASIRSIERIVHGSFFNPAVLVMSLLGFVVLLRINFATAFMLLLPVLYFAFISGVTFGQGSRIFFPAMITQAILVAVTLVFTYDLALAGKQALRRIYSKRSS